MESSIYQSLKLQVLQMLNLSRDAVHMHIGLGVFLASVMIWKKGRIEWPCLLPVLGVALLMELLDLRDDYNSLGHLRWASSYHDLLNTVFWPFICVIAVKINKRNAMSN